VPGKWGDLASAPAMPLIQPLTFPTETVGDESDAAGFVENGMQE